MQEALRRPLEQIKRNQEALARAMEGPFAAIARHQEVIRSAMEAIAAAEAVAGDEVDHLEGIDSEQAAWLREWIAAMGEWAPTGEQVEVFLSALSLLLALIVYGASKTDAEVPEELLTQVGILCAAGALLINRVRHYRNE